MDITLRDSVSDFIEAWQRVSYKRSLVKQIKAKRRSLLSQSATSRGQVEKIKIKDDSSENDLVYMLADFACALLIVFFSLWATSDDRWVKESDANLFRVDSSNSMTGNLSFDADGYDQYGIDRYGFDRNHNNELTDTFFPEADAAFEEYKYIGVLM